MNQKLHKARRQHDDCRNCTHSRSRAPATPKCRPRVVEVSFGGEFLKRGFWLYVWEVVTPDRGALYYVGRTGDSSSCNAQSPFTRMGQHLGSTMSSNMLRTRLEELGVNREDCSYRLIAYGPVLPEAPRRWAKHCARRNRVAAIEDALIWMTPCGRRLNKTIGKPGKRGDAVLISLIAALRSHGVKLNYYRGSSGRTTPKGEVGITPQVTVPDGSGH